MKTRRPDHALPHPPTSPIIGEPPARPHHAGRGSL